MSRQILEQVRDELASCGVISSNREFCVSWLAKDEGYMRGLRFRDLPPSADALATCASKLGYYARHLAKSSKREQRETSNHLYRLQRLCQQAMEDQARAKWMTAERMGL
ncbi:DUF6626 family protein [Salibaculum griseiflavum]|jgi:hypothetical protein|uniref:DUF6626 family protein n=1 Tax=Salibaculum griseiflavum TaxID=1914409 RepID=UPI001F2F30F6|nr:DUF6626 family protein [Salibaculum griseiflavum]